MSRSRMFRDDEPGTPSPRTTIVGGRPPEGPGALPPVPTGIQTLLRLAALDTGFRAQLLARRGAVAEAAGVTLTRSEQAILAAVPGDQIERMIDTLPEPPADRRTFLHQAAASAVVLLGGAGVAESLGCKRAEQREMARVGGAAPDEPPPRPDARDMATEGGAAPEEPPPRPDHGFPAPGGAAPDYPPEPPQPRPEPQPTRGIRPDVPPPRPDVPPPPPAGVRPDLPPPRPADVRQGADPDPFPGN